MATTKKTTVKKAEKKKPKAEFTVTLRYDDIDETKDVADIQEYLRGKEIKYIKTRLYIAVEHKGRKVERLIGRQMALRVFRNDIAAMSLVKNLKLAIDAK